jgi:hypothetical protein
VRRTYARRSLRQRPMRQRIIALVAAYAIALASLISGFGAAQAAAEAADGGNSVICHSNAAQPGPATGSEDGNGTICFKSCIGCLMSLATVIPPAVAAAGPPQLAFKHLDLPALSVRVAGTKSKAHRSRGPPAVL